MRQWRPGPRAPGLRRSGDTGGRAPVLGGGRAPGEDSPLPWPAGRRCPRLPRAETGREARHRYARGPGTAGASRRPRAPGVDGRQGRASLTSRPGRRTRGEGTRAHAGPRGAGPPRAAWPLCYWRRPARSGLAQPRRVCGQGQEQGV